MISRKERHRLARRKKRKKARKRWLKILLSLVMIFIIGGIVYVLWTKTEQQSASEIVHGEQSEDQAQQMQSVTNLLENEESDVLVQDEKDQMQETTSSDQKVTMRFVGDMMFAGNVELILEKQGYDYPFTYVKEDLTSADITIGNLETSISTRGEPEDKQYVYRSKPEAVTSIAKAGFDVVNTANNHILDYGLTAFEDTLNYLDEAGVKHVGSGLDEEEAYAYELVETQGIQIAFLGFSQVVPDVSWKADKAHPGVAETYDYTRPVAAIEEAREHADLVVVLAHWGEERADEPEQKQVEMAYRYIDAGADLVVGSHAHTLQGFEQYKGKWIAYNLGNFIFTTNTTEKTWETVILTATCSAEGQCDLSVKPIITMYALPQPMEDNEAVLLTQKLTEISFGAEVTEDGTVRSIETIQK